MLGMRFVLTITKFATKTFEKVIFQLLGNFVGLNAMRIVAKVGLAAD